MNSQYKDLEKQVKLAQQIADKRATDVKDTAVDLSALKQNDKATFVTPEQPMVGQTSSTDLNAMFQAFSQKSQANKNAERGFGNLIDAQEGIADISGFRSTQGEKIGLYDAQENLTEAQKVQANVGTKLQQLPMQQRIDDSGKLMSARGAQAILAPKQRQAQLDYLVASADVEVLQNNVDALRGELNTIVEDEYRIREANVEFQRNVYNELVRISDKDDQKQLMVLDSLLKERERVLQEQKQDELFRRELSLNAFANGADPITVEKIRRAGSVDDAINVGGEFVLDPSIKMQQEQFAETKKQNAFTRQFQLDQFAFQKNKFYTEQNNRAEDKRLAQLEAQLAQDKVDKAEFDKTNNAINEIGKKMENMEKIKANQKGLALASNAMGGSGAGKLAWQYLNPIGSLNRNKQTEAMGQVDNIIKGLTFEELARVTETTTLGQISNAELQAIGDSATALNGVAVRDNQGRLLRFDASPEYVNEQLQVIEDNWVEALDKYNAQLLPEDVQFEAYNEWVN